MRCSSRLQDRRRSVPFRLAEAGPLFASVLEAEIQFGSTSGEARFRFWTGSRRSFGRYGGLHRPVPIQAEYGEEAGGENGSKREDIIGQGERGAKSTSSRPLTPALAAPIPVQAATTIA
jgi:hypothetical protein